MTKIETGMGAVTIALSEAEFDDWEVEIVAHTKMGSITVIAPRGLDVRQVGKSGAAGSTLGPPIPGFPVVRLSASSDMGTIRLMHPKGKRQRGWGQSLLTSCTPRVQGCSTAARRRMRCSPTSRSPTRCAPLEWGAAVPDADTLATVLRGLIDRSPGSAISPEAPEAGRLRIFEAARGVFVAAATARPLLLVLDDLHWADQSALRLLAYLARRLQPAPVLSVGAYRQTELTQGDPLSRPARRRAPRRRCGGVTLDGLGFGEVAALLTQTLPRPPDKPLVERVCASTAGNPFFIEELVAHLQDSADAALTPDLLDVPISIQQVVARRVARLDGRAVALLTAGAVLGPEFDLELAAEVEGLPLDPALRALEQAVHGGLIVEVPGLVGRFAFAHALVRDTLVGSITAARRARLHALAAEALEPRARRDPERHLAALVHHALEGASLADHPLRAAELAEQAAASASAMYAYEQSIDPLERALGVLRRGGAERGREATVLCSLGEALQRSGDRRRAIKILNETAELAQDLHEPRLLARAALATGGVGVTILQVDPHLL